MKVAIYIGFESHHFSKLGMTHTLTCSKELTAETKLCIGKTALLPANFLDHLALLTILGLFEVPRYLEIENSSQSLIFARIN